MVACEPTGAARLGRGTRASLARSSRIFTLANIRSGKKMSVHAVGFVGRGGSQILSLSADWFQVRRVHACAIPTEMVEGFKGDKAHRLLVDESVGETRPAPRMETPVAAGVQMGGPCPAWADGVRCEPVMSSGANGNFRQEPRRQTIHPQMHSMEVAL